MYDAFPFDLGVLKIDEECQGEAGGLHIVEALRDMLIREIGHTREFDDQTVLDEDIGIIITYSFTFVNGANVCTWDSAHSP